MSTNEKLQVSWQEIQGGVLVAYDTGQGVIEERAATLPEALGRLFYLHQQALGVTVRAAPDPNATD